jgi:bifunctional ADP-heptose synthase (sugar kinase/adenylyltransferase)
LIEEKNIYAIIIQDYNKGLLSIDLINYVQKKCLQSNIELLVDPKKNNFKLLSRCDVFKPNFNEIATFLAQLNIEKTQESLIHNLKEKELNYKKLILTLAESGVFYKENDTSGIINGKTIENPDVSGAGDTVIAVLCILHLLKYEISRIAKIVNECGALVCTKKGVSTVSEKELQEIINKIA